MATGADFANGCRAAASQLRALPSALRRDLDQEVLHVVVEPLARKVAQAWSGPYAGLLSQATSARLADSPEVVVGGATRQLSGGATAGTLVGGVEYGARDRVTQVNPRRRQRPYKRHSTRQLPRQGQKALTGTMERNADATFTKWVDLVNRLTDRVISRG